jgi:DnaJ-class molecular chaperone
MGRPNMVSNLDSVYEECPECGGYGYYKKDHFGNDVSYQVACLNCYGWGYLEVKDNDR